MNNIHNGERMYRQPVPQLAPSSFSIVKRLINTRLLAKLLCVFVMIFGVDQTALFSAEAQEKDIPALVEALKDKNFGVRANAVRALGKMGAVAKDQIPAIAALLKDKDSEVRSSAAIVLGNMGALAKDQIPAIVDLLKDQNFDVREAAQKALAKLRQAGKTERKISPNIKRSAQKGDAKQVSKAQSAADDLKNPESKITLFPIAQTTIEPNQITQQQTQTTLPPVQQSTFEQKQITQQQAQTTPPPVPQSTIDPGPQKQLEIPPAEQEQLLSRVIPYGSLALIFLIVLSYYLKKRPKRESRGPADILVRDWAIDNLDDDRLGTANLSRSIGRFLRNENTRAPLTLAITGNWGSGKSSIMGMLKDYLDRAGFPTIWFNTWHHHEETHLFGALLEHLRQGLPAPWTPSGMWFRLRLFWIRMKKQPVTLALIGGLLVFTVAFFWNDVVLLSKYSWDWALHIFSSSSRPVDIKELVGWANDSQGFNPGPFAHLAALLAAASKILGAFTSFGLNPKTLFRKVSKSFNTVGFESDPGLRFKLDENLGDISAALGKKPLTIFIDDMDRCPPERALKVLESVNFLSSSPRRCFIVMGIWLNQTVTSISSEFANFIKEKNPQDKDETDKVYQRRLHSLRVEHAKSYLDKMIQIEIAVPKIKPDVLANLARNEEDKEEERPQKESMWKSWQNSRKADGILKQEFYDRPIRFLNQKAIPMIFLFMVFTGAFLLASVSQMEIVDSRQTITKAKILAIETEIATAERESRAVPDTPEYVQEEDQLRDLQRSRTELFVTERKSEQELTEMTTNIRFALGGIGSTIGLFGLAFGLIMIRKRNLQDSESYKTALSIWAPVMALKVPNPRHLKRLVNLLRLISMRDKDKDKDKDKNIQPGIDDENLPSESEMSESEKRAIMFILLMALEELEIELIEFLERAKEAGLQKEILEINSPGDFDFVKFLNPDKSYWLKDKSETLEKLVKALKEFYTAFPDVWPIKEDVERYREFLKDVVLREV